MTDTTDLMIVFADGRERVGVPCLADDAAGDVLARFDRLAEAIDPAKLSPVDRPRWRQLFDKVLRLRRGQGVDLFDRQLRVFPLDNLNCCCVGPPGRRQPDPPLVPANGRITPAPNVFPSAADTSRRDTALRILLARLAATGPITVNTEALVDAAWHLADRFLRGETVKTGALAPEDEYVGHPDVSKLSL